MTGVIVVATVIMLLWALPMVAFWLFDKVLNAGQKDKQ